MTTQEKSEKLAQVIIKTCKELEVTPEETLEVIGTSVVNILTTIAPVFGVTERKMLKIFADGIAKAELVPRNPEQKN